MTEPTVTTVVTESGEKIETTLPPEAVADLQAPKPAEKPAEPAKPAAQPASQITDEQEPAAQAAVEPQKPADQQQKPQDGQPPRDPNTGKFDKKPKPGPIATLLEKKHQAEQRAEAAEARTKELEAKLATVAQQPASPAATNRVKALAEKFGIDETLLAEIVATAREGLDSDLEVQLPKEVQDLLTERAEQKEHDAELAVANTRITKLAGLFKDEPIAAHKDKILALAYSTEQAPDGERYCDKELSELYFGFVKPEIEPGKPSAESSRGGAGATMGVVDFQAILDRDDPKEIEDMSPEQFRAYSKWMTEKQGDVPIRHK